MNALVNALTDNGAVTNPTSENPNLDLFFLMGSSRGKDITSAFEEAFKHNRDLATRNALWGRDIRGGAGERDTFRSILHYVINTFQRDPETNFEYGETAQHLIRNAPKFGRWDDLFLAFGTPFEGQAIIAITNALENPDTAGLVAKWLPRNSKHRVAKSLREWLKLTPKEYRQMLVEKSNTVEQQMSAKNFNEIEYSAVPSVAFSKYRKAFIRNDEERFTDFLEAVEAGDKKVNAGAIFPHDIFQLRHLNNLHMLDTDIRSIEAQWQALPNYLEGVNENILPVIDVSASMEWKFNKLNLSPIDVAVTLGLYIAERNEGVFKDVFMSFSDEPELHQIKGKTIIDKGRSIRNSTFGYSTDLQKTFEVILEAAKKHKVAEKEMPRKVIIISDMEFNQCAKGKSLTNFQAMRKQYREAGYEMPEVVFWNLNGRAGNFPVTKDDTGTALVSGFSPSILKSVITGKRLTPESVMLDTLMNERYDYEDVQVSEQKDTG